MGLRAWKPIFEETDFKITDDVYYGKRFKALTIRKVRAACRMMSSLFTGPGAASERERERERESAEERDELGFSRHGTAHTVASPSLGLTLVDVRVTGRANKPSCSSESARGGGGGCRAQNSRWGEG
jgi:hypothetical protein